MFDDTNSFTELSQKSRENVMNKEIMFQGYNVILKNLLCTQKSQFPNEFLTDACLKDFFTEDMISVGNRIPDFMQYCLPHRLARRNLIRLDILNKTALGNVFALTGTTVQKLEALLSWRELVGNVGDPEMDKVKLLVMDESKAFDQYEELCRTRSNVHWLHVDGNKLEWKRSQTDIQPIKFNTEFRSTTIQLESIFDHHERVVLITRDQNVEMCDPLPYLAQRAKEKDSCLWSIHVRIDKETEEYFHLTAEEFLISAAKINSPQEKNLLQRILKETGNIVVLLDVCYRFIPKYEETCCELLKRLLDTKIKKVIVTCHDSAVPALETTFLTLAFTIVKFDKEDQINFLHNFWAPKTSMSDYQLGQFIEKVLCEANALWIKPRKGSFSEKESFGIKIIQTAMIAEVFQDFVNDPTSNKLPEKLDVINLFQQFVEKRSEAHLKILTSAPIELITKDNYLQIHEHVALMNFVNKTHTQKILQSEYHDMEFKTNAFLEHVKTYPEKSVFIIGVFDDWPRFSHPLLAAYFASNVFAKLYRSNREFILEYFFSERFKIVRFMFDSILSKDFELHTAVIQNDTERVEVLLKTEGVSVNATDGGGRTALHLASTLRQSYSNKAEDHDVFERYRHFSPFVGPRRCHMVEILLSHGARIDIKDSVLHWSPLEYSLKATSWDAMEYLLASGANGDGLFLPIHLFNDIAKCAISDGFVNLFTVLLKCGLPVELKIDNGSNFLRTACWYGHVEIVKLLILRGADRRAFDGGENMLHTAVERGHLSIVRILLESPEKVTKFSGVFNLFQKYIHTRNSKGESALHIASRCGFLEIVKLLIFHDADLLTVDNHNQSSLHHACSNAHPDVARFAIQSIKQKRVSSKLVNKLNKQGESALTLAVQKNQPTIVKILLTNGADIFICDDKGRTLLHLACQYGYLDAVIVLLDSCNNLINALDKAGSSPLHLATWARHTDMVTLLVMRGGDIWAPNTWGRTCFHLASWKNDLSTLRALVSDKESITKDIDAKDKDGKTALHLASYWGYTDVIAFLITHGANTRIPDDEGRTCFHLTCKRGDISAVEAIVKILHKNEASVKTNINTRDKTGITALHLACYWGYSDIVQFLVLNGGDLRATDDEGKTCLHWTAMRHEINVAKVIIDNYFGCDADGVVEYFNVRDRNGRTARDVAIEMGRDKDKREQFVEWLDQVSTECSKQAKAEFDLHPNSHSIC